MEHELVNAVVWVNSFATGLFPVTEAHDTLDEIKQLARGFATQHPDWNCSLADAERLYRQMANYDVFLPEQKELMLALIMHPQAVKYLATCI